MRIFISLTFLFVMFAASVNAHEENKIANLSIGCRDKSLAKDVSGKFLSNLRSGNSEEAKSILVEYTRPGGPCNAFTKNTRVEVKRYDPSRGLALVKTKVLFEIGKSEEGDKYYWINESSLLIDLSSSAKEKSKFVSKDIIGCTTHESLSKITASGIYNSNQSPGCIALDKGTKVDIADIKLLSGVIKVKPVGGSLAYWVPIEFVD